MASAFSLVRQTWLFRSLVVSGWVLFALMVISISSTATVMLGRTPNLVQLAIVNLGWIIWVGGTFLVIDLARRFPVERTRLVKSLYIHIPLGLLVAFLILSVDFGIRRVIEAWPTSTSSVRTSFFAMAAYRFYVHFIIYWMILGAATAYDYHIQIQESRLLNSQLEAKLAQAQLHALKGQLHPHFLFNTHHSIISLMLNNENAAAIAMLTRLSDLLRMTLDRTDDQFIALKDELDAVKLYLGIQQERYRERLVTEIDLPRELLTAEVPCLILQPIVENAIKHGIDRLTTPGLIRVRVWERNGRLCLSVSDNGPGLPPVADGAQKGIGLQNTIIRLQRLYGEQHEFEILRLDPAGTEIRITIPWRSFRLHSASPLEILDG